MDITEKLQKEMDKIKEVHKQIMADHKELMKEHKQIMKDHQRYDKEFKSCNCPMLQDRELRLPYFLTSVPSDGRGFNAVTMWLSGTSLICFCSKVGNHCFRAS